MEKKTAILSAWRIDLNMITETYFLVGRIHKDQAKRYKNNTKIRTSALIKIDFETMTAETKNTLYQLKDMSYH